MKHVYEKEDNNFKLLSLIRLEKYNIKIAKKLFEQIDDPNIQYKEGNTFVTVQQGNLSEREVNYRN